MKIDTNHALLGLILGLAMPVITFLVFYLIMHGDWSIMSFVDEVIIRKISTQVISLCAVPNLLLFFVFIWTDRLYSARGVLMATFVIAFLVIGVKILS